MLTLLNKGAIIVITNQRGEDSLAAHGQRSAEGLWVEKSFGINELSC